MAVEIDTNYFIYCTRFFPFTCYYRTILRKLRKISIGINGKDKDFLTEQFIDKFLSYDNVEIVSKIIKCDYLKNGKKTSKKTKTKDLLKSDYVLFVLNKKKLYAQINSKDVKNHVFEKFKRIIDYILENIDYIGYTNEQIKSVLTKKTKKIYEQIKSGSYKLTSEKFDQFTNTFSKLKEDVALVGADKNFVKKTDLLFKLCNEIRDYFDALDCINRDVKILALVCRSGIINISFLQNDIVKSELCNTLYDKNSSNQLIEEAITKSEKVLTAINHLPKLYNFLNLNQFLSFKKCKIYDNPSEAAYLYESNIGKKISNIVPVNKGVFLKFIVDTKELNHNDISPMIYFDYFTLLIAYQHSYDEHTLWEFLNGCRENSFDYFLYKDKIQDFLQKPTEHMFFDNSLFTISTIDETININLTNEYLQNTEKKLEKSSFSHQVRIYSFWDYIYLCNSLAFGNIGLFVNKMFIDYVKNIVNETTFKPILNLRLARLSAIFTKIDSRHNHTSFSTKEDSNLISDVAFEKMGLIRSEKYLNESADQNWRSGNLLSSQTYQRYGILFSFIGILTGLFSYGLISKVDTSDITDSTYCTIMKSIFNDSPKIPVMLTFIAIPFVIWLVATVIGSIKLRHFTNNIFKLCNYKKKKN